LSTDAWRDLFEGNRWQLRELSLTSCDITAARARIVAECQRLSTVWALNLSGNWNLEPAGAKALFNSPHLRSVAYLNLSGTRIGSEGVRALSAAKDWIRLRSLDLSGTGVDAAGLKALLASPSARRLTWLGLSDGASREDPRLNFSPELATALTRLPHLAAFSASLGEMNAQSKQVIDQSESLAWPWILCDADHDVQNHRGMMAPDRWPPVDVRGSYFAGGSGGENGGAPV
jgi:hypothetical protein